MTRKKWNKLRKQRPELFAPYTNLVWERMPVDDRGRLRRVSKARLIAGLTAYRLAEL